MWIFDSSLTLNKEFAEKNERTYAHLFKSSQLDDQDRSQYLKHKVRKPSIKFSKAQAKKLKLERVLQEKNSKTWNVIWIIIKNITYACKTQLE